MKSILVVLTLLGLSLAMPQGDEAPEIEEVPEYAPLTQAKIIELYEFLKAELEGDVDIDDMEPLELEMDKALRNKRSAEASPFFFRWLFGRHHYGYGHRRRYRKHYYH